MQAAYVTTYDSSDIHAWSGLGSSIRVALEAAGLDITPIGNLSHKYGTYFQVKGAAYSALSTCRYDADREPMLLRHYARQVESALANSDCDIVISPGTLPIAQLRTDKPIVSWTDATFDGLVDFYPHFTNLCGVSKRQGHAMEQAALTRCSLALYSSQWAADSALRYYKVEPEKIKVVPFGANLDNIPTSAEVDSIIAARLAFQPVQLLFVGTDWERKRGDFAIEIAATLNQRGVSAELHIVGSAPARAVPAFVRQHGYLSRKNDSEGRILDALMSASHFLVLPSAAECCAVVLAEASAWGVPSLTTQVGGNQTAIRDGVNGQTFALYENPAAYCDFIQSTIALSQQYQALARSSQREYTTRLNWNVAGSTAVSLIRDLCGKSVP